MTVPEVHELARHIDPAAWATTAAAQRTVGAQWRVEIGRIESTAAAERVHAYLVGLAAEHASL